MNSGATVAGTGAITGYVTVNSGATLAPGNKGPGVLTIGNFNLPSQSLLLSGTLSIQLGGAVAGTGYDQIIAVNGANITGSTLSLTLVNGFKPMLGETFFVIDNYNSSIASQNTGAFSNPVIMDSAGDTYAAMYTSHDPNNPYSSFTDIELIAVGVVPDLPHGRWRWWVLEW